MDHELTIGMVAQRTGISIDTLRYYERAGLLFDVARLANGHRRYRAWHVRWVAFLTRLRAADMPIATLRRYAVLVRAGDETRDQRMAVLEAHRDDVRAKIDALTTHLEAIERKIRMYADGECAGGDANAGATE